MAVRLAGRGWLVFATMRDPARRTELDQSARAAGVDPGQVRVLRLDVTDVESISSAVNEIAAQTGGALNALVNNAGLNTEACFEDIDMANIRGLFDTVLFGAMEVTRAALPLLRNVRDPRLIFMSSFAAITAGPTMSAYSAAKAALERFAEALAWELAADGVHVTVVRPGFHRSNIFSANSGRVRPPQSRHRPLYDRIDPLAQRAVQRARDPVHVADKVAEILDSRHPGFRYSVGLDARLVAASNPFIPQRLRYRLARALFRQSQRRTVVSQRN